MRLAIEFRHEDCFNATVYSTLEKLGVALQHGDVYAYFDNTIGAHAYWNAQEFRKAV